MNVNFFDRFYTKFTFNSPENDTVELIYAGNGIAS